MSHALETQEKNLNNALATAANIEGWLSPVEAAFLYSVGATTAGSIVEIGSYFGKSTYLLAKGIQDSGDTGKRNLITIDMHVRWPEGQTRILCEESILGVQRMIRDNQLGDIVQQMIGWSDTCLDHLDFSSVSAIFLDSAHTYEGTVKEVNAILRKLPPNKKVTLLFHDYHDNFPGVKQAVNELVASHPDCTFSAVYDFLWAGEIVTPADPTEAAELYRAATRSSGMNANVHF